MVFLTNCRGFDHQNTFAGSHGHAPQLLGKVGGARCEDSVRLPCMLQKKTTQKDNVKKQTKKTI